MSNSFDARHREIRIQHFGSNDPILERVTVRLACAGEKFTRLLLPVRRQPSVAKLFQEVGPLECLETVTVGLVPVAKETILNARHRESDPLLVIVVVDFSNFITVLAHVLPAEEDFDGDLAQRESRNLVHPR